MKWILAITALLMGASFAAFGQCSDTDKRALEAFDKAWTKAGQDGDRNSLMAIYADDYAGFPTMQAKGPAIEATMATFEQNKANPAAAARNETDHYMIACTPTTATITHRNRTFQPTANGGKGATTYSRSVHFLEKRNGKWTVVSNAGGPLSDSDFLRYMEMDWIRAVKMRDYDWFEKNLADDFTEISFMGGKLTNKRQTIDGFKQDKTAFDSMDISDVSIRVDGNSAIVTGVGHAKGKMGDGKPFDFRARFTDTYVRRDGRWQAWHAQMTQLAN